MDRLWPWLTAAPTADDALDLFAALSLCLFAAGFVAAAHLARPPTEEVAAATGRLTTVPQIAREGLAIFGCGLVILGIRLLQLDALPFGSRLWMVVALAALAIAAVRWLRLIRGEQARSHHSSPSQDGPGVAGRTGCS